MNTTTLPRRSTLARLLSFVRETHPPQTYIVLSCLWSLSLMALLQGALGALHARPGMLTVATSFFLILLFLRAVDEIKDFDYDRRHNADRPLVRGDVTVAEVWSLAVVVACVVLVLNSSLDAKLALFAATDMAYGLGLLALERASRTFRESILLNLIVTFPVSAALNCYAWLYLQDRALAPGLLGALPIIVAHIGAFLHFEFGRKLKWPHLSSAGENGYALVLGARGAITVCLVLGLLATGLATVLHALQGAMLPWLPCLALIPSFLGVQTFIRQRQRHRNMKPYFAMFLVVFFVANIAVSLLSHDITFD